MPNLDMIFFFLNIEEKILPLFLKNITIVKTSS